MTPDDFHTGQRVDITGDRHGLVIAAGQRYVRVELDVTHRIESFSPQRLRITAAQHARGAWRANLPTL